MSEKILSTLHDLGCFSDEFLGSLLSIHPRRRPHDYSDNCRLSFRFDLDFDKYNENPSSFCSRFQEQLAAALDIEPHRIEINRHFRKGSLIVGLVLFGISSLAYFALVAKGSQRILHQMDEVDRKIDEEIRVERERRREEEEQKRHEEPEEDSECDEKDRLCERVDWNARLENGRKERPSRERKESEECPIHPNGGCKCVGVMGDSVGV